MADWACFFDIEAVSFSVPCDNSVDAVNLVGILYRMSSTLVAEALSLTIVTPSTCKLANAVFGVVAANALHAYLRDLIINLGRGIIVYGRLKAQLIVMIYEMISIIRSV